MDNRKKLLIASFLTLVAAGVGFATRGAAGSAWAEMGISQTAFGGIMGAGFVGFGVVILVGGFIVELLGYKPVMLLSVVLHIVSAIMLFLAPSLYEGWLADLGQEDATNKVISLLTASVFIFSICNGLYEAVINPLVGQLYPENQTHYLNILHAGWPGGMALGGLLAACFQNKDAWIAEVPWEIALSSYSLVLIVILLMSLKENFPETVTSKSNMSVAVLFSCFASIPFLVLIVIHGMIGYMELGVDSWQTRLMEGLVENSVTVLIYTSILMFILRFFAGPIAHKLNPIGLLLASSVIAVLGLFWLSMDTTSVLVIFAAATLYSLGKAFLWPTMLAVAGERYPQSGAVAMSALGAAGMLTVGLGATTMIGAQQSNEMTKHLQDTAPEVATEYVLDKTSSFLGYSYSEIDPVKQQDALDNEDNVNHTAILNSYNHGSRQALRLTAIVPVLMGVGFLALLLYYKSQGGYKVITLSGGDEDSDDYPTEQSSTEAAAQDESPAEDAVTEDAPPVEETTAEQETSTEEPSEGDGEE
ncbi:MAG: hypothetical protein CMJ76_08560 [Planctomycetaceae bacterium]|nr:hypothetical protein [Planctomycetaceae bacterium]